MSLLNIASIPAATVHPDATVFEAVRMMSDHRIGAVAVVNNGALCGIFTERDLMMRVVAVEKSPHAVKIKEVMTGKPETATRDTSFGDALRLMVERHIRHLPVVDEQGRVLGMLSVRNVLQHHVEDLSDQLDSITNYLAADGIGG
jgi:CBS domain-containing protein